MFLILVFIVNNFYLNSHWIYSALKDFFVLFICVVHNVMLLIYIDFWPHFRNIVVYGIRNKPFLNAIYYLCGLLHTKCTCDSDADDNKDGMSGGIFEFRCALMEKRWI